MYEWLCNKRSVVSNATASENLGYTTSYSVYERSTSA
eukprot:SAG25_NODE_8589_length_414_cov_1.146032_1_plen_36_part_10